MPEGRIIATAIKNAENIATKLGSKGKPKAKVETKAKKVATAKVKAGKKVKAKSKAVKKVKPAKVTGRTKIKKAIAKKAKSKAAKEAKNPQKAKSAVKKKGPVKSIAKPVVLPQVKATKKRKLKIKEAKPLPVELLTHGDDLHIIPVQGEIHPVRIQEARNIENVFHHKEEIALHQENLKVKQVLANRKNTKRFFRSPGRR